MILALGHLNKKTPARGLTLAGVGRLRGSKDRGIGGSIPCCWTASQWALRGVRVELRHQDLHLGLRQRRMGIGHGTHRLCGSGEGRDCIGQGLGSGEHNAMCLACLALFLGLCGVPRWPHNGGEAHPPFLRVVRHTWHKQHVARRHDDPLHGIPQVLGDQGAHLQGLLGRRASRAIEYLQGTHRDGLAVCPQRAVAPKRGDRCRNLDCRTCLVGGRGGGHIDVYLFHGLNSLARFAGASPHL